MATARIDARRRPTKPVGISRTRKRGKTRSVRSPGAEQWRVLRKYEKQRADEKEYGELEKDDEAAGENGAAAVGLIARGEEALNDGLVCAVCGHGEKGAADHTGPKGIGGGEAPRKIEKLQFVAVETQRLA